MHVEYEDSNVEYNSTDSYVFDENYCERLELAIGRLTEIPEERWDGYEAFKRYFDMLSGFALELYDVSSIVNAPAVENLTLDELRTMNHRMYEDILPENYEKSFGNPVYATQELGNEYGSLLSFLYAETRSGIAYAYENKKTEFLSILELILEIYSKFSETICEEQALPTAKSIKESIYYYMYDYADVLVRNRVYETISPTANLATDIIMNSDLTDLRFLYRYGEYIGENEIETAKFLNSLSEDAILSMAKTYVGGFVEGFKTMRIDLSAKKSVNIRYFIGQERMIRASIELFKEHDLEPIIFRYPSSRCNRKLTHRIGYAATPVNKQFDYDHRMDEALFLDKAYLERKLSVMADTYEKNKELAGTYAGPAVIEVFGENPFTPAICEEACRLSKKQQELSVRYAAKSAELSNKYIPRDKYSFTIIAYPIPEIGDNFKELFAETVKINTLDNELYKRIQQSIIDTLNEAEYVEVVGANGNKTNMKVMLHAIDPATETNFENCLADVNIPVGEVFTSPVLEGTEGILHVSTVYLNELKYTDLCLTFQDGKIADYTCGNFDNEEENKAFIKENLMFNHDTLPIGEFAIGTNTTAYVMASKYDILYKLPILIVEKMGPHFAVGDTCYSYSEDNRLYNPDGKEIVAKDNSCSLLRNSEDEKEREKAYFNCHTDITIPYEEIGGIYAVTKDGTKHAILCDGRFVLPGTEELNRPLEELV